MTINWGMLVALLMVIILALIIINDFFGQLLRAGI
jgi:hypothetical protein